MLWIIRIACLAVTVATVGWAVEAWPGWEPTGSELLEIVQPEDKGPAHPVPWTLAFHHQPRPQP